MFKTINGVAINVNQITHIQYIGVDDKDDKEYCRIFLNNKDESGIVIQGSLERVIEFLSK